MIQRQLTFLVVCKSEDTVAKIHGKFSTFDN